MTPLPQNVARKTVTKRHTARSDADKFHIAMALDRVKDPMLRYAITMFVDLLTEKIQELEDASGASQRSEKNRSEH